MWEWEWCLELEGLGMEYGWIWPHELSKKNQFILLTDFNKENFIFQAFCQTFPQIFPAFGICRTSQISFSRPSFVELFSSFLLSVNSNWSFFAVRLPFYCPFGSSLALLILTFDWPDSKSLLGIRNWQTSSRGQGLTPIWTWPIER
jgi:hypothetical protein